MRIKDFDEKVPSEVIPLTFDFSSFTDNISTVVISLSVKRGSDPGVDLAVFGSNQIVGSDVRQLVQAGLDGVMYLARCDVTNSAGEKYSQAGYLPVCDIS